MTKKTILLTVFVAVLAAGLGFWLALPKDRSKAGGDRAIEFALPNLKGETRSLKSWQGKVVVLNFWATWCPPCRDEIPILNNIHEGYQKQGLVVVGIAIDKKEKVVQYSDDMFITYPILIGNEATMGLMEQYGNRIGALPFTVIIDRGGNIVDRKMSDYKSEAELIKAIKPYLKGEKPS